METNDTKDKQQSRAGGKTVSVVMCTYNGERFLREQLDSILAQTYPLREIIIQDDGSTDATPAICREYEARYPIVRFIQNEHNLGYNASPTGRRSIPTYMSKPARPTSPWRTRWRD